MSISVIITHFAPKINCDKYRNLLKANINNLRDQVYDKNIEIIVCDDGSYWTRGLYTNLDDNDVVFLDKNDINSKVIFIDLDFDQYYGLSDVNRYRAVRLKNLAIKSAKYDKIIMLDDDHFFSRNNSIKLFSKYLDRFSYVKGRVIGTNNLPQLYISRNAQGTTYGFTKELYIKSQGFSKYLYENAYGEDNDILYRFFRAVKGSKLNKGCFAGDIITRDMATNRWLDRVKSMNKNEITTYDNNIHQKFIESFYREHGVHPTKGNVSRIRYRWLCMSSFMSWLYEIKYIFYYIIFCNKYFSDLKAIIRNKFNV